MFTYTSVAFGFQSLGLGVRIAPDRDGDYDAVLFARGQGQFGIDAVSAAGPGVRFPAVHCSMSLIVAPKIVPTFSSVEKQTSL